jgi:hypothetical protein
MTLTYATTDFTAQLMTDAHQEAVLEIQETATML